jgi:hypothetical protein
MIVGNARFERATYGSGGVFRILSAIGRVRSPSLAPHREKSYLGSASLAIAHASTIFLAKMVLKVVLAKMARVAIGQRES